MSRSRKQLAVSLIASLCVALALPAASFAAKVVNLGKAGNTYPVQEKDLGEVIRARGQQVKPQLDKMATAKLQAMKNYKPKDLKRLPTVKINQTRLVDMTYTVKEDIPWIDQNGRYLGVLYPKGYKFNPLVYRPYKKILVVINGNDPNQINWFASSVYAKDIRVNLLLSDGNYYTVSQKLRRPAMYLGSEVSSAFHLRAVPSIVYQSGDKMLVKEIVPVVKQAPKGATSQSKVRSSAPTRARQIPANPNEVRVRLK